MKIIQRISGLVVIALMLALSVSVFAQPTGRHRGGQRGGMFKHKMHKQGGIERFADEIGLSENQLKKLKTIKLDAAKEAVAKRSEVKIAHIELRELIHNDNPDESAIKKQVEKIGRLKTDMMLAMVDKKLAVRKILTDEQQTKLKELRKKEKKNFKRGDRKGRRHGFGFNDDGFEDDVFGGVDEDYSGEPSTEQEL